MAKKSNARSDLIKHALSQKHKEDIFLTECKTGATWTNDGLLKFDGLAIKQSWASPCITGYEVKVSRQDFQRDEKWLGYKNFCHRFYFVCPHGMIKPEELPDDVGLIYFNEEKGTLYTKRAARMREIEISAPMLYYILISRTDSDRHPFFSNQREMLEAFVQDKVYRSQLGKVVGSKMAREMQEMHEDHSKMEREFDRLTVKAERFDELDRLVHSLCGFHLNWYNSDQRLTQALTSGLSGDMQKEMENIIQASNRLSKMMEAAHRPVASA